MNKFLTEIEEQPKALKDTLAYYMEDNGKKKLQSIITLWKSGKYKNIIFTGMGSSYFIAYAATCLFNSQKITSLAINAGELIHYQPLLPDESTLLVCISQSGESFEITKILENFSPKVTTIAICNEKDSTLAKKAHVTLLSKAGREDMTSSKTYISTYLVTYILSLALGDKFNKSAILEIEKTIQVVTDLLKTRDKWLMDAVKAIAHVPFVQFVGRGPVFASVQQSSLMLMEATHNPASALLGGEFRHGPMEMIKKGTRVVIFSPAGKTYDQSITATADTIKFRANVLLITDQVPSIKNDNLCVIEIPHVNEALFVITSIVPMQLIINQWSIEEKNEPGNFVHGAKVTTIE